MVGAHRGGEKMNRIMTDDEKEKYIRKQRINNEKITEKPQSNRT